MEAEVAEVGGSISFELEEVEEEEVREERRLEEDSCEVLALVGKREEGGCCAVDE